MALTSKPLASVRATVPVQEVQKEKVVRVNLNVPESQRTRWKKAALDRNMELTEMIIAAVEADLLK